MIRRRFIGALPVFTEPTRGTVDAVSLTELLTDMSRRGLRLAAHDDRLRITGPHGALDDDLRTRIAERRTELLQFLREHQHDEERRNTRIARVDRDGPIPASFGQRRLWLIEQLATDVPIYNMYMTRSLSGDLDTGALRGAVEALTARHEILRTALVEDGDDLFQAIDPDCAPAYTEHDATGADEAELRELLYSIVAHRFDLATAPLIRFDLIRTGERDWILVITQHHVISDGWSTGLIRKELSELYTAAVTGRAPELAELPVQYADFAAWERQWVGGERAEQQRAFWRERLADLPPVLELSPGRRRSAVLTYRGDALVFHYSQEFMDRARALCAECGTTLYGALVAAYGLLLSRMTRTDDLAVGSPLASRPYPVLENTLGLFFNSITIRVVPDPRQTVREFLATARRTAFEAFANQDLPFDHVVQAVAPERSASHAPLFQTIFILQSYPEAALELPGLHTEPVSAPVYATQYDLMFKLREETEGATGFLLFNEELLTADDVRRFVDWFEHLVTTMAADPSARLGELALADPASLAAVREWNAATAREVPAEPITERILRGLHADRRAVSFRGRQISGAELVARARAVAGGLHAAGLRRGDRVGILVPRSADLVTAMLGALLAGVAYVPLDGAAPEERSAATLSAAGCTTLVTGPGRTTLAGFTGTVLPVDRLREHPPADLPAITGDDIAYVIFTSGSTGTPKGVEVTHANLTNLFTALDETVPLPDDAVWLAVTNATFDIAVLELLWTLARGARVVLGESAETLATLDGDEYVPPKVPDLLAAEGVTALQATPTYLRTVLRMPGGPEALGRLHTLLAGGEPLDPALADALRATGVRHLLNMYGPTETTVWSTAWRVPESGANPVLVGRPLANTTVHIVDAALLPVPVGMFGELVIGGAGVTRGYTGRPDLTAERFLTLPHLDDGRPVYRTGDLARLLPDGQLELVGRFDNQVKLNGYRIELEEIERAAVAVPGVAECAVVVQTEPAELAAHYVVEPGAELDADVLRTALARTLPPQMVPSRYARIAALPVTPNGKLDRRALPRIADGSAPTPVTVSAEGELETALLAAWRQVLGNESVGVTDDFFRSGGNSLLVVRLLSEVRAHAVPDARIVDLFRFPTVRAYAAHLTGAPLPAPRRETDQAAERARQARERRREQVLRKRRQREPDPSR